MNDTTNYADMIEIPVQTSIVTVVEPTKKRIKKKRKTVEELKDAVIEKVNSETDRYEEFKNSAKSNQDENIDLTEKERALIDKIKNGVELDDIDYSFNGEEPLDSDTFIEKPEVNTVTIKTRSQKPSIKKKFIAICCIIFVFAVAVTSSVVIADRLSLPTLFSSPEETQVDKYTVFNASIPSKIIDSVTIKDGVMSVSSKGAVYSCADGVITSITTDGETFTVEITHGEDFKTVFSGMDLTYFSVGEKVYKTLPLGYSNGETAYTVSLYSASGLITDYSLKGDTIVWAEDLNGVES